MKKVLLFLFSALLLVTACHKDPSDDLNIGIEIDQVSLSLRAGETATINATVTPADLMNKTVLWTSDNTDVAKVSRGVVTAVAPGTATITAKTDKGGKTAKCKVTVLSPVLVSSIRFDEDSPIVDVHETAYPIPFTVLPAEATDPSLDWTSSDENIAKVKDGVLTAVGKGTVTITATARDAGSASASCEVTILNIPDAVDLGLSVKWASFNLGAETPEGYGDYFAWGELTVKESYDVDNYRFSSAFEGPYSKYNTDETFGKVDNKTVLETVDDVAYKIYKGHWRMPTEAEFSELIDGCTWTWSQKSGIAGYTVSGKKTGYTDRSIFLPAAGFKQGREYLYENIRGLYWTSTLDNGNPVSAYIGSFEESAAECIPNNRFVGLSIRPVCK